MSSNKTHKSRVNELCQSNPNLGKPQYSTEEANGGFKCTLTCGQHRFVSKTCPSKKEAEHQAASTALQKLEGMVRQKQATSMAAPSHPNTPPSLPNLPDLLPSDPNSNQGRGHHHSLQSHAQQFASVVQSQVPPQSTPPPPVDQSVFTERSLTRHTTAALPQHPSQTGSPDRQSTAGPHTLTPTVPQQRVVTAPQVHSPLHFAAPHASLDHSAVVAPYPATQLYTPPSQQPMFTPPPSQPPFSLHRYPHPSQQQQYAPAFSSMPHPSLQSTISHASGPTPSLSQGLPPDPVTDLDQLCASRGWSPPEYQYWERRRTIHQVSVTCGTQPPYCINNGQFETVDLARRTVADLALRSLRSPTYSPFASRGGPESPATHEVDSRTHQLERLCTEASLPQPQIEINQAVKEGYGTGVVALVTVGQERFISAVESDRHNACENALEKAMAWLAGSTAPQVTETAAEASLDSTPLAKQLRYKNDLQELLQKRGFPLPTYTCRETNGGFIATVSFVAYRKGEADTRRDISLTEPQPTKKKAEQAVAKRALDLLTTNS